jgi:hypothetical protein
MSFFRSSNGVSILEKRFNNVRQRNQIKSYMFSNFCLISDAEGIDALSLTRVSWKEEGKVTFCRLSRLGTLI